MSDDYGITKEWLREEANRVVKHSDHRYYCIDSFGNYERDLTGDRMIRIKHSIHKPEGPINLLIHKDILKNATKEIIWIKNGDGRYIRISPNDYSSPECWSDINQALKNIHNG